MEYAKKLANIHNILRIKVFRKWETMTVLSTRASRLRFVHSILASPTPHSLHVKIRSCYWFVASHSLFIYLILACPVVKQWFAQEPGFYGFQEKLASNPGLQRP